jgi:pimeloyl-ACP methyl ester carboxylesterase
MTTLICLHGFTQNGAQLRKQLDAIARQLPSDCEVLCPDAPHACAQASVDRMYASLGTPRQPPPYLCWWDATDDGRTYRGWETTRDRLAELCERREHVLVLGFSQGAMLTAGLAALSAAGQFPRLSGVVLVAGYAPRSDLLRPLFERPIVVPSLHVWGERDGMAGAASAALVEAFDAGSRQSVVWPGPHAIPRKGPAASAIVAFVRAAAPRVPADDDQTPTVLRRM